MIVGIGARGSTVVMLTLTLSCATLGRSSSDPCGSAPSALGRRFDSTTATRLAGRYRLTLIEESDEGPADRASAALVLLPTDSLHRFYETAAFAGTRRRGDRPLWGWTDFSPKNAFFPHAADPNSRSPDHPGVLVHSTGLLELGVWRGLDGSSTSLTITQVSDRGFRGTWASDQGLIYVNGADGRRLPNPHGHFCALRI